MRNTAVRQHLRALVRAYADPHATEPVRAGHARTLAEYAQDLRDATALAGADLNTGVVLNLEDAARGGEDGRAFAVQRAQYRALADLSGLLPQTVHAGAASDATSYGPTPVIRQVATVNDSPGTSPVIPAIVTAVDDDDDPVAGPFAVMDPVLPITSGGAIIRVADAGAGKAWHYAGLVVEIPRQVTDFGPGAQVLLDQLVLDDVDTRAELWAMGQINAAAGDTTAVASGDVAAALDLGESQAAVAGLVDWLVVNPVDLPSVRAALPAAWGDTPHPEILVSVGQTVGTGTFLGHGAVVVEVQDYQADRSELPRVFGRSAYVMRPVYVAIRRAAGIQTVTGL